MNHGMMMVRGELHLHYLMCIEHFEKEKFAFMALLSFDYRVVFVRVKKQMMEVKVWMGSQHLVRVTDGETMAKVSA